MVVALIGMFAAIVLVSVNTAGSKGRDGRRIEDARQIQNALNLYFDAHTAFPASLSLLVPAQLPVLPTDPLGGASYLYEVLPGNASYHLGLNLEQGDNVALQADADINSATVKGSDATNCAGALNGRHCYDLRP